MAVTRWMIVALIGLVSFLLSLMPGVDAERTACRARPGPAAGHLASARSAVADTPKADTSLLSGRCRKCPPLAFADVFGGHHRTPRCPPRAGGTFRWKVVTRRPKFP